MKTFDNGGKILNLRVATSETWKDKDGERQERTEWHQVVIKNENLAKIGDQYLSKGDRVGIEGKIQTRKWKDNNDNDRYSVEIVVGPFGGELILLENPKSNDNDNQRGSNDRGDRGSSRGGGNSRDRDSDDRGGRGSSRSNDDGGGRGRGRDDDRGSRNDRSASSSRGGNSSRPSNNDRNDMDDDIPF
jgi:single-strand DNA-binding protein